MEDKMEYLGEFTHLHVHTEYSLLDGSIKVKDIMKRAKELNMDSIALTDHGAMFGAVEFYKQGKKYGINPILGSEVYVAIDKYTDKEPKDKGNYHLVLLAENNQGYVNLMKIVSEAYVNGFYYKPRIDHDILRKYSKGIIALSACLGGEVAQHILKDNYDRAKDVALIYNDIFGQGNFFLELQDYGLEDQRRVNESLRRISKETGIPMVATNDVHYLKKEDARVHDVLLCIQTGKTIHEENRMKFPADEFYLKSKEEMYEIFKGDKEALINTYKISKRCRVEMDFDTIHLPEYSIPDGYTNVEYLREISWKGLEKRYEVITDEIKDRFEYEFNTISNMGYVDYFLIVWDFIRYAKENEIQVGPGRGSSAGSIVTYALEITDIDPLEYNLIFERFLNPERVSMPDIDIDFCYERREEVIDYVVEKYGHDKVVQIATFGTMAARGSIRDVGRALDMSYGEVDYIAKQIPMELNMTIDKALNVNKQLRDKYESDLDVKRLIDFAREVEGLPRHTSTHAAGVLISKEPVTNFVPLLRNGDYITTQFNMIELEELGLLKMDFLGLRTLTVIRDAINLIYENHGKKIDFDKISYEDTKVLEMFSKAETLGIFQFESPGMRNFLKELRPNVFENLIAANALYRPGPMNQIPTFVMCKHDNSKIEYIHPKLEGILDETYGCIVYQEQVMQIVRDIGGYSLGRADLVRRAMSKKKMDVMEEERKNFIYGQEENGEISVPGSIRNGVDEKSASKIYDLMIDFANYAFPKSHSAAYAVVAYRTAWLKYYYPVEFMAALISSVMGVTSSVSLYIQECKRLKIEILPPSVNQSFEKFTVTDGKIRYGLSAVKNVGSNFIKAIVDSRADGDFVSLTDFVERIIKVDSHSLNKRAVESLIKCGAFDELGGNRAEYLSVYEKIIDGATSDAKRNVRGQFSIFDTAEEDYSKDILPKLKEFPKNVILQMEKELAGIYISGHPLEDYKELIEKISNISTVEIKEDMESEVPSLYDGKKIVIGGLISEKKTMITKNNNMMAFLKLEDLYGEIEGIIFPKIFEKYRDLIKEDSVVRLDGRLSVSEVEEPKIIVETIRSLSDRHDKLYLKIEDRNYEAVFQQIKSVLRRYKGDTPVYVYLASHNQTVKADQSIWVDPSPELLLELKNLLGQESVKKVQ